MSEQFGKYELLKKLATGGMAQIYLARLRGIEGFERMCVVKRILPHLAENDDFVRMFLHEAKIAARLNHPNIVQIYDLGQEQESNAYYIAMEYIHGEDLRRVGRRTEQLDQELPIPVVLRIIADAAAGLNYAHKRSDPEIGPLNIVHRDISPQNILVSFDGSSKVVDFGIAKAADADMNTRSGVLKGKYSYMSPEQAEGLRTVDHRSDLFALGVVLYEMLTGARLFKRSNDIQTLTAVMECKVAPPSSVNPRLPRDLDAVVLKALARDPEARYQDGASFQQALENWLLTRQLSGSTAQVASYMRELYADRLAAEAHSGQMLPEELPEPKSAEEELSPKKRTPTNRPSRATGSVPSRAERSPPREAEPVHPEATTSFGKDRLEAEFIARPAPPVPSVPQPARPVRPPTTFLRASPPAVTELPAPTLSKATDVRRSGRGRLMAAAVVGLILAGVGVAATSVGVFDGPRATIRIETEPDGATVIFNGRTVEGVTPLVLPPVKAGRYSLVVGKERFNDAYSTVEVPSSGEVALPPIALVPVGEPLSPLRAGPEMQAEPSRREVAVTLVSQPPGASVWVNGQALGVSPATVRVAAGAELQVKAELSGFVSAERTVRVGANGSQKVPVVLERSKQGTGRGDRGGNTGRSAHASAASLSAGTAPGSPTGKGWVRFVISPMSAWADVSCGDLHLGTTPMPDQQLPVGVHECTFKHPDLGIRRARVEVRSSERSTLSVKFN